MTGTVAGEGTKPDAYWGTQAIRRAMDDANATHERVARELGVSLRQWHRYYDAGGVPTGRVTQLLLTLPRLPPPSEVKEGTSVEGFLAVRRIETALDQLQQDLAEVLRRLAQEPPSRRQD